MKFYSEIASAYDEIFPLQHPQYNFVAQYFSADSLILDIGCGTGNLAIKLAQNNFLVYAFDSDETMLNHAEQKAKVNLNIRFFNLTMKNFSEKFSKICFDGILCFGNTIVHLNSFQEVENFFCEVKKNLAENGKFLFQIINYNRILDQNITSLPTIETDNYSFIRNYSYNKTIHKIIFHTILKDKHSQTITENKVELLPLRKSEIAEMLAKAGFRNVLFFSDYNNTEFHINSQPFQVISNSE